MAQLDETNPLHQKAISQLKVLLLKFDDLESRLNKFMIRIRDKVDYLMDTIDRFLDKLDFGSTIGDIVTFLLRIKVEEVRSTLWLKFNDLIDVTV